MGGEWLGVVSFLVVSTAAGILGNLAYEASRAAQDRAKRLLARMGGELAKANAVDSGVVAVGGDISGTIATDVRGTPDKTEVQGVAEKQDSRIERLTRSFQESQVLISELQAEMDAKVAAVNRLRAEEQQSRQLAALREEEAKAVRNLINASINSAHLELQRRLEKERDELRATLTELQAELGSMQRSSVRQQIVFLAIGILFSIPIGIFINIIW